MREFDCDLFVIGGGSGGVRAARRASENGKRVILAENAAMGGTCVNVGCIPKKIMMYAASFAQSLSHGKNFGWNVPKEACSFDWSVMKRERDREVQRLRGLYGKTMQGMDVPVLAGPAQLAGQQQVRFRKSNGVERMFRAREVLIATGSKPFVPATLAGAAVSDDVFALEECPKRVAIVGSGFIAVEFASIFSLLGAEVTMFVRGPCLLRGFDSNLSQILGEMLQAQGIKILFETQIEKLEKKDEQFTVALSPESLSSAALSSETWGQEAQTFDFVLAATGRRPATEGLGLSEVGIECAKDGAIVVDENHRTSQPWAYAIGDVTNQCNLTPAAIAAAESVVEHLYGNEESQASYKPVSYEGVPFAVFSLPPMASVGMTENQVLEKGMKAYVWESRFKTLKHQISGSHEVCYIKVISEASQGGAQGASQGGAQEHVSGRILGMHMLGTDAPEIIQSLALGYTAGLTMQDLTRTMAVHPTVAEEFFSLTRVRRALLQ